MIFLLELKPQKGKRSAFTSGNFGFDFDFLQFASVKSFKIFTISEMCPMHHSKAEKKELQWQFLPFLQICVFYSISNLVMNFFINRY